MSKAFSAGSSIPATKSLPGSCDGGSRPASVMARFGRSGELPCRVPGIPGSKLQRSSASSWWSNHGIVAVLTSTRARVPAEACAMTPGSSARASQACTANAQPPCTPARMMTMSSSSCRSCASSSSIQSIVPSSHPSRSSSSPASRPSAKVTENPLS